MDLGHPDLATDLARIREAARRLLEYLEGLFLADGVMPEIEPGDGSEAEAQQHPLREMAARASRLLPARSAARGTVGTARPRHPDPFLP